MATQRMTPAAFIAHLIEMLDDIPPRSRRLVALAGPPASGKTTLANRVLAALERTAPGAAAVVPMDGFHFDDAVLVPRGWRPRKGAPHTFDVGGLAAALQRLKVNREDFVAVPRFDRDLEISRAGAMLIDRSVRLVLVEGNYLLLNEPPWPTVHASFDVTALIRVDETVLAARLDDRWRHFAVPPDEAAKKIHDNDLPNGRLIYAKSIAPILEIISEG